MTTPDVEEFRNMLMTTDLATVVRETLLSGPSVMVPEAGRTEIREAVAVGYGVAPAEIDVRVVGSAKLGFSIVEKAMPDGVMQRFRPFGAESDIDVAIISPAIFSAIWEELSAHAHQATWWPPAAGKLGDYLMCGWLRPDHFPKNSTLLRCRAWWNIFRKLSRSPTFGRRKVRGGLFFSEAHLMQYHLRAVRSCAQALEALL